MADMDVLYHDDEDLAQQLAAGLRTHPQAAAQALKAIVEEARGRAAAGDFLPIRGLADRADDAVEQVKMETGLPDERLAALAGLAQQVCAVLAIMGGSDGRRDSGYYRAPLAHAERLDAMTDGVLRLVDLVNLIGQSENQQINKHLPHRPGSRPGLRGRDGTGRDRDRGGSANQHGK